MGSFGMELLPHPAGGESTRRDPHFLFCACFSQPTPPAAYNPAGVRREEMRNVSGGILCSRKARGLSGLGLCLRDLNFSRTSASHSIPQKVQHNLQASLPWT